jgi:hypothetical protein
MSKSGFRVTLEQVNHNEETEIMITSPKGHGKSGYVEILM